MSAFGGRRDIMHQVMPLGPCVHTGTFVGHLIPVMATSAFLDVISEPDFYPALFEQCEYLYAGLRDCLARHGVKGRVQSLGARFSILLGIEAEPGQLPGRGAARSGACAPSVPGRIQAAGCGCR